MKFNLPRRQRKSFESIIGASSNNNFNKTQSLEIFENVKKEFMKSPKTFGSNTGKQDDILEIRSLLFNFDKKPELFSMYAEAQLFLQKNKREEALKKLYHILELSEKPLTNLIKYQLAYVLVLQAQYMNAIDIMTNIDGESIFIELSYILNGEVFDYILNDGESAINYYLEFLEKYPDSIYYDQIRLRLRELVG